VIRDYFSEDVDSLFIDSKPDFKRMRRYVGHLLGRQKLRKLRLYQEKIPLFESKKIEREIEKIYANKVFLKSGAYIVIEKTEGLIVIDVNSGRFKTKANFEQAAYSVNVEAAKEIARQLRLRDFSGIIVIDFIDMQKDRNKKGVLDILRQSLSQDRAKTEVLGISKLGLVEMTRERTAKPVESAYFKTCPYCNGRGKIKNN
jgi:ribonuclease G